MCILWRQKNKTTTMHAHTHTKLTTWIKANHISTMPMPMTMTMMIRSQKKVKWELACEHIQSPPFIRLYGINAVSLKHSSTQLDVSFETNNTSSAIPPAVFIITSLWFYMYIRFSPSLTCSFVRPLYMLLSLSVWVRAPGSFLFIQTHTHTRLCRPVIISIVINITVYCSRHNHIRIKLRNVIMSIQEKWCALMKNRADRT